jgi:hypothetical protein
LAYLDQQWSEEAGTLELQPIEGFVELGVNATPPPSSTLLARGNFGTGSGAVELEAFGEGSSVTGHMTVSEGVSAYTVDLQCARTSEDGLIMLGGYTFHTTGGASGLSPEGTLAGIILERGSPVKAIVWHQGGGPTSEAPSCLAFLDERLERDEDYNNTRHPIEGTVELGPADPSVQPSEAAQSVEPTSSDSESIGGWSTWPEVPITSEGPWTVVDRSAHVDAPRITVTIPAPSWTSTPDFGGLVKGPDEDPPQSAMWLWAWPARTDFTVWQDPCDWAGQPRTTASSVDELASALAAQPSRDASDPIDVTVGGYAGKIVTLHVPEDWDASSNHCDLGILATLAEGGGEPWHGYEGPAGEVLMPVYPSAPGQIDELWILDVDGGFAIIDVVYRPDTPAALIDEMRTIAASASFELP